MKRFISGLMISILAFWVSTSSAQIANGTSTTTCTQSGTGLVCTTSTSVALPSGVNLTTGNGFAQFELTGSVGPTPALSGCSITPAAPSVPQGSTKTLSVSCAAGTGSGSGVTYSWARNGNPIAGAYQSTYQVTSGETSLPGQSVYAVTVSNNVPSQAVVVTTLTITPVITVVDYCPASPVRSVIEASSPYSHLYTSDFVGSFVSGDNFVIQLNVSTADSTVGRYLAQITYADFGASRGGRLVTVSQNKCDYTSTAKWVSSYNYVTGTALPQNGGSKSVSLNEPTSTATIKLTPGVWYINIQDAPGYCPVNVSCHAILEWYN